MPEISTVIITYNEEKNIGRCLDAVKDISDEILIVDSFSTDKTEEICRQYNVRFIKNKFIDFVDQKNYAVQQATFDHILSLDADEVLSDQLKESIMKAKHEWQFDGWFMNRLTSYCGKWIRHSGWYPDRKIRLFDRRKAKWSGIRIHEKIQMSRDASVGYLKGDLLHYTYHSISEHARQADKYTNITAEVAFAQNKKSGLFKILFSAFFKFFKDYIFKLGFLDGYYGYVVCRISAHATFLKYIKLKELNDRAKGKKENC